MAQHVTCIQAAASNTHKSIFPCQNERFAYEDTCAASDLVHTGALKTERHVTVVPVTFITIAAISLTCPAVIYELPI